MDESREDGEEAGAEEILDPKDWLTLLVEQPKECRRLMLDPEVGILVLMANTYGEMLTQSCKENVLEPTRRDLLAPGDPGYDGRTHEFCPNLVRMHILTALATDDPVRVAFRGSMKEEDIPLFDAFHPFLVAQIRALHTRPFEANNSVGFIDNFIDNVLMRGWYMKGLAYMRVNSVDEDRTSAPKPSRKSSKKK